MAINTDKWITQLAFAKEQGVAVQNVHNWVKRGNLKWQRLPGSKIILVDKDSLSINNQHHKRTK